MDEANKSRDFQVLVVGAGSVGCIIAQRCKMLGIKCTLFERENYLNERNRDWNFGIYHAKPQLDECVGEDISKRITSNLVDPIRGLDDKSVFPMIHGQTGEMLKEIPTPNAMRLSRSKFRVLIADGLHIQYSKRLRNVECPHDSETVTVLFEDNTSATGNLLVGADGANSRVREFLLGKEKAALQPLALFGCGAVETLSADISRRIREINNLYIAAYHPEGANGFMARKHLPSLTLCRTANNRHGVVHNVPDPDKPETWQWMFSLTWPDKDSPTPTGADEIREKWLLHAKKLAEPFRSAYLEIAPSATIWCDRLAEWRTEPWDNRNGRVTLAGDAAHPMTYRKSFQQAMFSYEG
ncbi:MAG: hypothetical protein Q9215_001438 [Flavoplaca cf. flavocitrina]